MIKKVIIIFISLAVGGAIASHAQSSAQATMRVSVQIVSGSSVTTARPDIITLVRGDESSLGMLTIEGIEDENVIIHNSEILTLRSKNGNEMTMNVLSQRERNADDSESINYKGISVGGGINSIYRGELDTTIEYL